ncbi:hypothetical protein V5O48_016496 [Marasmius crinis-equi]|uniref:Uncharacterized protein n=1 Tax=Marasmius crinis-equi TaxID=585013 RepID=A0ABR3ERU8_9AGAR
MPSYYYHQIAPRTPGSGLPPPFKLAEPIFRVLRGRDGQLELIQALDSAGRPHLLIHVTPDEERRLRLSSKSEVRLRDLEERYEVLSPIRFEDQKKLFRKMEKMEKVAKQEQQSTVELLSENGRYNGRCDYEWGRLYKRILFDRLPCTEFNIPSNSSIPFETLSKTRVMSFCFTAWQIDHSAVGKNTILDLGFAFAEVCLGEGWKGLKPIRASTVRLKEKVNVQLRQKQRVEGAHPTQPEILEEDAVRARLRELLPRPSDDNDNDSPVILLVNDETKTKTIAKRFGFDMDEAGFQSGLKGLFRFEQPTSTSSNRATASSTSYSRYRSRSPSRNHHQRERERDYSYPSSSSRPRERHPPKPRVHILDIRALYERVSKTHDPQDGGYVPGIARNLGLPPTPFSVEQVWNAALDAELLIDVFNVLIRGLSIDEEHDVLHTVPRRRLEAPHELYSVGTSADPGGGEDNEDDDDDDDERDPNEIVQRVGGGGNGAGSGSGSGSNGAGVGAYAPAYDDYSDYGSDEY